MMETNLVLLHLLAGLACGEKATCGDEERRKIKHMSEESAAKHALDLNNGKGRHKVEPYPCPFCYHWHVGREMSIEELRNKARRTVAPPQ